MRQRWATLRGALTANVMDKSAFHGGTSREGGRCNRANVWWHTYCLAVSGNLPEPTHRPWTPSRPNSRNTGLPARNGRWVSVPAVVAAMICCRLRSRKPWRNSPSASTRRAAFTDTHHIGRRGRFAQRLHRRRATRQAVRSPLPAIFLPAGFFCPSFTQPLDPSAERESAHAAFQTATAALIAGWQM